MNILQKLLLTKARLLKIVTDFAIDMRTKANETKRYSLRKVKKRDFRSEEMIISDVRAESRKSFIKENKDEPLKEINQRVTGSTKRKKGKPVKTITKEDLQNENEIKKSKIETMKNVAISPPKPSPQIECPAEVEDVSSRESEDETPVYQSLYHATSCKDTETCQVKKCDIAKQFISHCSQCNKRNDACTICKAMDIMVSKHAQACEIALEKCCPVPRCDKVRLMVLEEWVTLKHKHNEMMQRVFRGLIHAKRCQNKSCELVLCKNIKSVLLHTHTCEEKDNCKTKQFIIQLCEHHQQVCNNIHCDVEFCQKDKKKKEAQNNQQLTCNDISAVKDRSLPTEGFGSTLHSSFPLSNNFPTNMMMQWPHSNPFQTSPFIFPTADSTQWPPNAVSTQWPTMKQNYNSWYNRIPSTNFYQSQNNQLPNCQQERDYLNEAEVEPSKEASLTEELYNNILPFRDQNEKSDVLPRLSPNELQSILMTQMSHSVIPKDATSTNNMLLPTEAQCQQLDDEYTTFRNDQEVITKDSSATFACPSEAVRNSEHRSKSESLVEIKEQAEWAKIDFLQQQVFQDGGEAETETADETDSENEIQPEPSVDEGYCVTRLQQNCLPPQNTSSLKMELTSIEKNFFNLMEDQKLQFKQM